MQNKKIAIVTDSSSSLDFINHDYDHIYLVRMPINFAGVEYIDGKTITVEEFYHRLETEDVIPTTSQPSLGETLELYEQLKEKGYTDIIHLPISKGISGTYQSLFSIKEMVDGVNITIIDTKSTAIILGYIVLEAARLVLEGKTVEEVIEYSNYLANNFRVLFMVDDLRYLIKNGRLSNAAGFIGSVLKIKPILTFNDEGEIVGIEKIRTSKKAMAHSIETMINESKQYKKVKYLISYGADQEFISAYKAQLSTLIDLNDCIESILPSVIGAHVGTAIVGFGFFILDK